MSCSTFRLWKSTQNLLLRVLHRFSPRNHTVYHTVTVETAHSSVPGTAMHSPFTIPYIYQCDPSSTGVATNLNQAMH